MKCRVPLAPGSIERDFITVAITVEAAAKAEGQSDTAAVGRGKPQVQYQTRYVDITLPVRPLLVSLKNLTTGRAAGFADEEAAVVLTGVNLQHVTGVLFGDQEARVEGLGDAEVLAMRVPKASHVPRGETFTVPVVFKTGVDGKGRIASGGIYTYLGEPLPPGRAHRHHPARDEEQ